MNDLSPFGRGQQLDLRTITDRIVFRLSLDIEVRLVRHKPPACATWGGAVELLMVNGSERCSTYTGDHYRIAVSGSLGRAISRLPSDRIGCCDRRHQSLPCSVPRVTVRNMHQKSLTTTSAISTSDEARLTSRD